MNKITLVLGDWSDDGHGKTDIVVIDSNLDSKELMQAYRKGSKKVGFNLIDDVCGDYEDSGISYENLKSLVDNGLELEKVFEWHYDLQRAQEALELEDRMHLSTESYTTIFLFICKLGNEEFKHAISKGEARINIGGYGLFE